MYTCTYSSIYVHNRSLKFHTYATVPDAQIRTLLLGLKSIVIAQTPPVYKLSALPPLLVIVPLRVVSLAGSGNLGQVTAVSSSRLNANSRTLLLALEAVTIAFAAAVPETGTASVFHVIEPFDGVVAAWATLLFNSTAI